MQVPKPSEDDSLPAGMDPDLAAQWVEKAWVHVGTLPPKVKKPARKK